MQERGTGLEAQQLSTGGFFFFFQEKKNQKRVSVVTKETLINMGQYFICRVQNFAISQQKSTKGADLREVDGQRRVYSLWRVFCNSARIKKRGTAHSFDPQKTFVSCVSVRGRQAFSPTS